MEISDAELTELLKKWQIKNKNEFFANIGEGRTDIISVRDAILESRNAHIDSASAPACPEKQKWEPATASGSTTDDIMVINAESVKGLEYKMAHCCNPVYGDDVFGFVTIKDGVKIHRMSCPNAARLIEKYPYRIQRVQWSTAPSGGSFQTTLRISAIHENQVITDISHIIEQFKASIRSMNLSESQRSGTYEITIVISVSGNIELDKVIAGIRSTKGVVRVLRA